MNAWTGTAEAFELVNNLRHLVNMTVTAALLPSQSLYFKMQSNFLAKAVDRKT